MARRAEAGAHHTAQVSTSAYAGGQQMPLGGCRCSALRHALLAQPHAWYAPTQPSAQHASRGPAKSRHRQSRQPLQSRWRCRRCLCRVREPRHSFPPTTGIRSSIPLSSHGPAPCSARPQFARFRQVSPDFARGTRPWRGARPAAKTPRPKPLAALMRLRLHLGRPLP